MEGRLHLVGKLARRAERDEAESCPLKGSNEHSEHSGQGRLGRAGPGLSTSLHTDQRANDGDELDDVPVGNGVERGSELWKGDGEELSDTTYSALTATAVHSQRKHQKSSAIAIVM